MSTQSGATRVAARHAWRGLFRSRLQSVLVILITALPFAFYSWTGLQSAGMTATAQEKIEYQLGNAIAVAQALEVPNSDLAQYPENLGLVNVKAATNPNAKPTRGSASELVNPAGYFVKNTAIPVTEVPNVQWHTAYGVGRITSVQGSLWSSKLGGSVARVIDGRVPAAPNEIMVSPSALTRLGVQLGDTVKRANQTDGSSQLGSTFKVVGVLATAGYPNLDVVFARDGALAASLPLWHTKYYFVTGPELSWDVVKRANQQGIAVLSRQVLLNPPPASDVPAFVAEQPQGDTSYTGLAWFLSAIAQLLFYAVTLLLPIGVLTGAAFSYGMRRQTHGLAIVASQGASPRTLALIPIFSALMLSLTGALAGMVLGLGIGAFTLPALARGDWNQYSGFHMPWLQLGMLIAGALVLAVVVSVVPVRQLLQLNVLTVMRGNSVPVRLRVRSGVVSLILIAIGLLYPLAYNWYFGNSPAVTSSSSYDATRSSLTALLFLLSILCLMLGLVMGAGWILRGVSAVLLGLGRAFNWLTPRFAARDLLLSRRRFSPLVASSLILGFVVTGLFIPSYSSAIDNRLNYQAAVPRGQVIVDTRWVITDYSNTSNSMGNSTSYGSARQELTAGEVAEIRNKVQRSSDIFRSSRTLAIHDSPMTYFEGMKTSEGANDLLPIAVLDPSALCSYNSQWMVNGEAISSTGPSKPCEYDQYGGTEFVVGDEADLRAILGGKVDAQAEATLAAGGLVSFSQAYLLGAKSSTESPSGLTRTLDWYTKWQVNSANMSTDSAPLTQQQPAKSVTLPVAYSQVVKGDQYLQKLMISPTTAEALGMDYSDRVIVFQVSQNPSQQLIDQWMAQGIELRYDSFLGIDPDFYLLMAWLVSLGLVLAAAGIAVGLTQLEGRNDQRTFARLGASRWFVGSVAAVQVFATVLVALFAGSAAALLLVLGLLPKHTLSHNPFGLIAVLWVVSASVVSLFTLAGTRRHPERSARVAIE